jgi:ribonuclease D
MTDEQAELPPAVLAETPFVIDTDSELAAAIERLRTGTGPFGVDAERASGFKYSNRAYLIQISRRGGGTHLIDPIAFENLTELGALLKTDEWILHAATQDLTCLAEVGLVPSSLFDTELGSRLAGLPRVGLAAVTAELLGLHLAKEHSAADWSTRPLPESWLAYAALDVEYLPELRDALAERLQAAGKTAIAQQEFANLLTWTPAPARPEPWRRLSQIQTLGSQRQLAVARELWVERDTMAQERDSGPGRLVPDRALVAAAKALPTSKGQLAGLKEFTGRESRKELERWWTAISRGLSTDDLPPMRVRGTGLPTPRNWKERHPEAYARFVCTREEILAVAANLDIPVENVLAPETVRRLCWEPPTDASTESIRTVLTEFGAREWQIDACASTIAECFEKVAIDPTPYLVTPVPDEADG